MQTTSEKSLLDALREGLDYIETNKGVETTSLGSDVPIDTTAEAEIITTEDNNDNDDDEEVSILDFLLNGEKALISSKTNATTTKPVELLTNSPMHIRPILPETEKNETIKFAMLPMSLYNMIKDDGTIIFEQETNSTNSVSRIPNIKIIPAEEADLIISKPMLTSTTISTTNTTPMTTKTKFTTQTSASPITKTTTESTQLPSTTIAVTPKILVSTTTILPAKTTTLDSSSTTKIIENQTEKIAGKEIVTTSAPVKLLETSSEVTIQFNTSTVPSLIQTTKFDVKNISTQDIPTTTKILEIMAESRIVTNIVKPPTTEMPKTKQTSILTTSEHKSKPTTITTPKFVEVNSNPSILETDMNYDYSELTLPPSLPNLKIIPFLPTDAVQNINAFDLRKNTNYNYHQSNSNPYSRPLNSISNSPYSPFNIKPTTQKYPPYIHDVADDRIDYDSYKPTGSVEEVAIDYGNLFAVDQVHRPNTPSRPAASAVVDSKIDYSPYSHKINRKPINGNKITTTTVKNVLNQNNYESPFDHLYHYGEENNSFDYDLDPNEGSAFASNHEYPRPIDHGRPPSPFDYSAKSKFSPPIETEGKNS